MKAEALRILRPKKDTGIVEAGAFDGGDVSGFAAGQVQKQGVVQPAFGVEAKGFVLLLPRAVFRAFPAAANDGLLAVGRPAGELGPRVGFAGEIPGQAAMMGAIGPHDRSAHGDDIGMASAGAVGLILRKANEPGWVFRAFGSG